MVRLGSTDRARLPDRAFAYIDSQGRRRLPIHDASHVRNALARFNQVRFEDDAARDRARTRLLVAAKRFRIVPVGFISNELRSEREHGQRTEEPVPLPSGFVTMLLTDIDDFVPEAVGSARPELAAGAASSEELEDVVLTAANGNGTVQRASGSLRSQPVEPIPTPE